MKPPKLSRTVIALGLVSLFNDASSEIIYPLLPLFLTSVLGAGPMFIGLIEGAAESLSSLLKLPAGWLSDRVRRRKPLVLAGYALAALTRPLLSGASAAWQVLALRLTDRVGKGIRSAPRDALIADSATAESRGLAFGFHRAMDHVGAILGALASATLLAAFEGDLRQVFLVASVPAIIAVGFIIIGVREQATEANADSHLQTSGNDGRAFGWRSLNPEFRFYLAVLLLFTLSNSSDAFLLLRAAELGISAPLIPILWAALHVSKAISSLIGGSLSDRLGRKALIISGWALYAGIYLWFAFAQTAFEVWALFTLYGLYFGLTEGAEKALVADLVGKSFRGTAYGLYNLVIGVAAFPASLLTGILWQRSGARVALLAGAAISLCAAVLMTRVHQVSPESVTE
jgi:MFS family permease